MSRVRFPPPAPTPALPVAPANFCRLHPRRCNACALGVRRSNGDNLGIAAYCVLPRRKPSLFCAEAGVKAPATDLGRDEIMDRETEKRSAWSWWYLLFVVQLLAICLAAILQQDRARLGGHSVFLLVSDAVGRHGGDPDRDRLFRHRSLTRPRARSGAAHKATKQNKCFRENRSARRELDRPHRFHGLVRLVTWLGFAAARWRRAISNQLHEWGLGGRRFGTVVTWFLLGGDLYTAYTFIAVPALAFGAGALGFFAVPYTIARSIRSCSWSSRDSGRSPQARLHHRGRFRARPLRQSLARARGCGHRHRRHHALYRAAAGRPGGGHRRPGRVRLAASLRDLPL